MAVLGIESTAHTIGVGIVEQDGERCRVLANRRALAKPGPASVTGGIHPREAAQHHSDNGPALAHQALADAKLDVADLDAIAFSQGPGLGPCLRVGATMARALAIRHDLPLVGVNHCVAHLEIGRGLCGADDPLLLYVSGANTQVIALARGRYRVFGETLDVGLGNALDKFAREQRISFPGGPEIEQLALQADPAKLLELPYTVKGMDLSFAGLATAAQKKVHDGHALPDVCHALQEHAFAALVEVTERALAHTRKGELLLGGGVACNTRLQTMARTMADERGVRFHVPPRDVLVDNGAMIAWLGLQKMKAGAATPVAESQIRPYERTDHVEAIWAPEPAARPAEAGGVLRGAEATLEPVDGRLVKRRLAKAYRHPVLDGRLRAERTRDEGRALAACRREGIAVPLLYDVDRTAAAITMERLAGTTLAAALSGMSADAAALQLGKLGAITARLHAAGITHGDLTPHNVMLADRLVLIDFGLAQQTNEYEPRGVDLHLVEEALEASDARAHDLVAAFLDGYRAAGGEAAVLARLEEIRERGRYR